MRWCLQNYALQHCCLLRPDMPLALRTAFTAASTLSTGCACLLPLLVSTVYSAANISGGHLNPAVTVSTLACGFYPVRLQPSC